MADINNCTFSGRLVRDAEKKTLPSGTGLVTFDIANNTGFGEYEKVMYVTINLWGKSGDNLFQYLTKGKAVGVWGELEVQKWTSKHDGSNQSKLVLNCSNVRFLGSSQTSSSVQKDEHPREVEAKVVEEDIAF